MTFIDSCCTFSSYNHPDTEKCTEFKCDNEDLNDFFNNDARNYSSQLLGKTYCFTLNDDPTQIVCAFTISNDSVKTNSLARAPKEKFTKKIPHSKRMRAYPAVLIGRLGVNMDFQGKGIGREVLDFIKAWFIDGQNKTGCRYIVVDAYNEPGPLGFYSKNGFEFLCRTEDEERAHLSIPDNRPISTRLMYFDLITLKV